MVTLCVSGNRQVSRHTRAPWGIRAPYIIDLHGRIVALMPSSVENSEQHRAKARLMAAAPHMPAALGPLVNRRDHLAMERPAAIAADAA